MFDKPAYSLPHFLNIVPQLGKWSNKTALFPCFELLLCIAWGHEVGGQAGISKSIVWTCFTSLFKIYLSVLLNVYLKIIQ